MKSITLVLLLILAYSVSAQSVPSLINYQGRLSNADGSPLATADYQLTFNIYDATNGGNLIWGPQIFDGSNGVPGHGLKIPVVQGYFNVMLGPVDTTNRSLADAFNGSERYVEITVSNRPPISPRQRILTAPFAFNSARLAGYDWSAVFNTNDPITGKISGSKLANGTVTAQQLASNTIAAAQIASNQVWLAGGNAGTDSGVNYLGTTDNQGLELRVNGRRALRLEANTNSLNPNLIAGNNNSIQGASAFGSTIAGGAQNTINERYSFIGAGLQNTVANNYSAIGGGHANTIPRSLSVIGGGEYNTNNADHSFIGGGSANNVYVPADYASISGGLSNTAAAHHSVVGGGSANLSSGFFSTVSGGNQNSANGDTAAIGGGFGNVVNGQKSVVPGGENNRADGDYSLAAGRSAQASHADTFVWNDSASGLFGSSGPNQFLIHASGGVGIGTNSPATALHVAGTVTAANFTGSGAGLTGLNGTNLAAASVTGQQIATNSVILRTFASNAPTGGIVISDSCGAFVSPTPSNATTVSNFDLWISTRGNPVEISFVPDGNTHDDSGFTGASTSASYVRLRLLRDGVVAGFQVFQTGGSGATALFAPPGAFRFLDFAPTGTAGTYHYQVQIYNSGSGNGVSAVWMRMVVREL